MWYTKTFLVSVIVSLSRMFVTAVSADVTAAVIHRRTTGPLFYPRLGELTGTN